MGKLILGTPEECYVCGSRQGLERHHIYAGTRRKISEKYGACVTLCHECHQGKYGAHGIGKLDFWLKAAAQESLMAENDWDIDDFIRVFGRNYL